MAQTGLESLVFAKRDAAVITDRMDETEQKEVFVSEEAYQLQDEEAEQKKNRHLIMEEIKRRDEEFYVKWCNDEN